MIARTGPRASIDAIRPSLPLTGEINVIPPSEPRHMVIRVLTESAPNLRGEGTVHSPSAICSIMFPGDPARQSVGN